MIETEAVERKRSRGGFLTLFDWSGKSRKKLLSSTTSSGPSGEASKQEKQNAQKSSLSAAELEENGKSLTYSPRRDSSCSTSTVTSDDRQASRAPSVVARLMGLESLPVPSFLEPRSNTDFDPFFKASTWDAYESLGYVNLRSHYDGISWDHLDSRTNNNECNRPINRFQTETLPPKSAKPISVTHNRLLSPIRSPGFVQSRNPAQVMEAASRMIEPSPRIPAKPRFPSSSEPSSSSIPMRIRDLREKLEASQKRPSPQVSNATRNNNNKRATTSSLKTHEENKVLGSKTSKAKPPSVSSSHTKANTIIHKQESSTSSSSNRAQKEKVETKNRVVKKDLASTGRKIVAKQNNQKQNQLAVTSVTKQKGSKGMMNKVVNKVLVVESGATSRKPSFTATSSERNTTGKKNLPRKKEPANGVQERIKRGEKLKKCNISVDTEEVDRKKDMDVISFTFSSPIKGISSIKKTDQERDSALSLSAAINGDSLNILLEQKLRELTSKIESSSSGLTQEGESSGSISKDWVNGTISLPSDKVSSESESVSDCTSFYNNRKFEAEEQEVNSFGTEAEDLQTSNSHKEIEETESVTLAEAEEGDDWELEYITEIIASGQMMVKEISLGMATDILPWSLFEELEGSKRDPHGKVERRTVFEFANEWLTLRCEKMFMGSCGGLVGREGMVFGRKEVLAEEVKREMERLKKMREMVMMDELVDNEMSSFEGRWLDYKREGYEVGSEIEEEILSDLVDELVSDLLLCY